MQDITKSQYYEQMTGEEELEAPREPEDPDDLRDESLED